MEKYKKLREIGQGSFGRVALVQEKKGKCRKLVLKEVEVKRMAEGEQEKVTTKEKPINNKTGAFTRGQKPLSKHVTL